VPSALYATLSGVATLTVNRPDLFPAGTNVGVYPGTSFQPGQAPGSATVATGTSDSAGAVSITSGSILSLTGYIVAAQVGGVWNQVRARSTLDTTDLGRATGTANTSSGSTALSSVSAATGAFAVGQRVAGPGIPPGTLLQSGSGASWTMTDKATANGTGVAIEGHGARVPAANLGATAIPSRIATGWRAQLMQRRSIAGTS
jgi:hypothetical protein